MNSPVPVTPSPESAALRPTSLVGLFEAQAKQSPARTAVICGTEALTFETLNQRATRLAGALAAEGATVGKYIGIALPRSLDLIIALLAILKTGAAYIPIDPGYPEARIRHMIDSSGVSLVITTAVPGPSFDGIRTLTADASTETPFATTPASADDPIYAIFTSGSTGLAKAASVFHRGFANLLAWYVEEFALGEPDTTLVISSPSFDLTQKNFFAPLVTGGTLILDQGDTYDIHRISGLIRDHGVTLVNCTPSAFYPLVDAAAPDYASLSTLRFAILGGEPISVPRLRAWLEHPSCEAEVANTYGPTECTDICAFHRLHRGNLDDHSFVPTGREIPNVTVTIRDEDLNILPAGEPGELCIEGIGLGGGYLNDPDRTADRFTHGLYRTGDLAKRLPDGIIEFRGRADHQVKVNGFRIELGEIEAALGAHPDVREAIVLAENQRLIAFVQGSADAAALKEHLGSRLPSYMVPGEFRAIETFPLTPNGKIDRAALAGISGEQTATTADKADSFETPILTIWSEVLGHAITDPTANFFDIGGNSIHLAIVHVKLRAVTGRDLSITDLFAHPSARSLAAHLNPAVPQTHSRAHERARLQQAGLSNFRRPLSR